MDNIEQFVCSIWHNVKCQMLYSQFETLKKKKIHLFIAKPIQVIVTMTIAKKHSFSILEGLVFLMMSAKHRYTNFWAF